MIDSIIATFVSVSSVGMTLGAGITAILCLIGFCVRFVISLVGKEGLK